VVAGRVVFTLLSAATLVATGMAWGVHQQVNALGTSHAIAEAPPRTPGAPLNILVIGLTTRLDQNGNELPKNVLDALHAGDGSVGGYNTNTMIVLHVPGDGSRVQAVSIPRDDYVQFAKPVDGEKSGKIKEAYGLAKDEEWNRLYNQGTTDHASLEQQSREAGRKATIDNVQQLLGIHVDHFAEISLAGFYDLATQLGGVDVCLNHATSDPKSGANFPAGQQHLDGAQALAFVRQRDNLTNEDLDRTHRQQAFLASVTKKLKDQGVFGSLGRMQDLLNVAKQDVVVDAGWDLLDFAQQASALTSANVEFHTLPIKSYGQINGQDVNIIDVPQVQAVVHTLFSPPQPATSSSAGPAPTTTNAPPAPLGSGANTIDVRNGSGQDRAAGTLADALAQRGFIRGQSTSIDPQPGTQVFYGRGGQDDAKKVADLLGGVPVTASSAASANHVVVYLGKDFAMPSSLGVANAAATSQTPATTEVPTEGPQGGAVTGGGIPCVD
jgi:LCP family protein required for cell wall assembly